MIYLGGKARIAVHIADVINQYRAAGQAVWDPFCGGLSVAEALSRGGPVWATDACAPLIAMYSAVKAGWEPPTEVDRAQYALAKALPDSDPLKAFCGFACSFGGDWFSSYAPPSRDVTVRSGPDAGKVKHLRTHSAAARKLGSIRTLPSLQVDCVDFLRVTPEPLTDPPLIYCDPPYAGTSGYPAVGPFNYGLFMSRVSAWSAYADVLVSEYAFPLGVEVWSRPMRTGQFARGKRTERLFYVKRGSL